MEVPELPGCAADGSTYQEAVQNAEVVVHTENLPELIGEEILALPDENEKGEGSKGGRVKGQKEEGRMKFEILTPLGFMVRTSESYWQRLITKHPDIADLEDLVQQALKTYAVGRFFAGGAREKSSKNKGARTKCVTPADYSHTMNYSSI